jgi:heme A synthase
VVAPTIGVERSTRALALVAAGLIYLQIVFGALLTHAGWLELHLTGALAVFVIAPMLSARLRRSADPVAARLAPGLTILLVVQLVLGAATLVARSAPELTAALALALPVTHRLVSFSVAEHIA